MSTLAEVLDPPDEQTIRRLLALLSHSRSDAAASRAGLERAWAREVA